MLFQKLGWGVAGVGVDGGFLAAKSADPSGVGPDRILHGRVLGGGVVQNVGRLGVDVVIGIIVGCNLIVTVAEGKVQGRRYDGVGDLVVELKRLPSAVLVVGGALAMTSPRLIQGGGEGSRARPLGRSSSSCLCWSGWHLCLCWSWK